MNKIYHYILYWLLKRTPYVKYEEVKGNNRSVMPLDVLGCTRVTLNDSKSLLNQKRHLFFLILFLYRYIWVNSNVIRDWDCQLQLFDMNEEYLVSMCHQRMLITSLPFVHTARRCYRWMFRWNIRNWKRPLFQWILLNLII